MAENSKIEWTDHTKRRRINPLTGRPGPAPQPARDGDKKQARQRVNVEVRTGRRPHPNTLSCVDCCHVWREGERRHEYDHHLGYQAENHLDVQPVCTRCQRRRSVDRGEIQLEKLKAAAARRSAVRKSHCSKGHAMSRGSDGAWRCRECRLEYWRARPGKKAAGRELDGIEHDGFPSPT